VAARTTEAPGGREPDRRFDAPEWEQNPFFELLKRSYLAASEHLLAEAGRQTDLDPAEHQRLLFHLRQLVDASSPTLYFPTNPAALRNAFPARNGVK
jgi:polyhydroxyalkanoate synthase